VAGRESRSISVERRATGNIGRAVVWLRGDLRVATDPPDADTTEADRGGP
jgi:hypothetical protein